MEMRIRMSGIGLALPKLSFGINLFSGIYIELRNHSKSPPYIFGVASTPDTSGKNGTLLVSHVYTEWTSVDISKHPWICNRHKFVGRTADVEIKGTLIASGKIDLVFKIYDQNGEPTFSLEQIDIKGNGFQLTDTKIRGRIVDMMTSSQRGLHYCE